MGLRSGFCRVVMAMAMTVMTAAIVLAAGGSAGAQTPPPAAPAKPEAQTTAPAQPAAPAPTPSAPAAAPTTPQAAEPKNDAFGEEVTLTAKPMVYVKGNGTWDKAFETISGAFKKLHAYVDKEGLKADDLPMTIFTATDDTGFDYEAALPVAEPPKTPPAGDIAVGQTPEGRALKFVHRGSYDGLDDTYEAITNYLDEKRLDAKDSFIEQYVTDPVSANENKLVVNVYVLIKSSSDQMIK